jgi:hypothetical protein
MQANPFQGPLEGEGPEIAAIEAAAIWTQKRSIFFTINTVHAIFPLSLPLLFYTLSPINFNKYIPYFSLSLSLFILFISLSPCAPNTKYLYIQRTIVYVPSSELRLPQTLSRKRVRPPPLDQGGTFACG